MFRFVIYKNSVLATICSFFGAAFIAMAIMSAVSGELEILPAIGVVAAGIGLMWLGNFISDRKEQKKRAKAQNAAQASAEQTFISNSNISYTQPRQTAVNSDNAINDAVRGKSAKISPVLAAIFFLLAAVFGLWSAYFYAYNPPRTDVLLKTGWGHIVAGTACILLMIGCFRTRSIQRSSCLNVIGFLGLIVGNALIALRCYHVYGLDWYTSTYGVYAITYVPLFKIAVFFLMLLFAIFSMRKTKMRMGGIVRALWFVPALALLPVTAKIVSDNRAIYLIGKMIENAFFRPRGDVLDAVSHVFLNAAILFCAFSLRAVCKKPAANCQQAGYVQPEAQYAEPVRPAEARSAQPQVEPRYTTSEEPKAAEPRPDNQDVEKKLQAYKDLLDCGILTPEEYEEKLRELRREC